MKLNDMDNKNNSAKCIKKLSDNTGFSEVWYSQSATDIQIFLSNFKTANKRHFCSKLGFTNKQLYESIHIFPIFSFRL